MIATDASAVAAMSTFVARDGTSLAYRYFPAPPGHERGRIIYLHGIQSHGGWYTEAAAELARRGYTVYLPDRRGSGLNTDSRGSFGSREQLLDDLTDLIVLSEREQPQTPLFLLGNCWGAKPAVAFALREQAAIAGLILLCPGIITRPDLAPKEKLRVVGGRIIGPHWRVPVPLTDEMYTGNPTYLDFIRKDPLMLREVTPQFLLESFIWDRSLPRRHDLRVPVLVMQAGRDPIVDIPASRRWFDSLESSDKSYREYPDFGHTFDFEEDRQRVWDHTIAWLDNHTDARATGGDTATRRATTVQAVEVLTAELPFRFAFGHALAKRTSSTNVFVKVTLSDGSIGFGEGVPREYVTGETIDSAFATLTDRYAPALLGREITGPDAVPALLDEITHAVTAAEDRVVDGAARCALELALLDAAGRSFGLPISYWLGVSRSPVVRYSAVIPFSSPRRLAIIAVLCRLTGLRHVKIKVGDNLASDLRVLRLLRRILGARADLRVDANCAWNADEAIAAIGQMRHYGISGVEQPLPAEDLDGLRRVTAAATTELIIVDESLRTAAEAADLAASGACTAYNIRVSKCGGLLESARIARIGAEFGITCIVGAQVGESAILSAAGRHLAAHIGARYVEGSAGRLLLKGDISSVRILPGWGGRARPYQGAGMGITIDEAALRAHARRSQQFEATKPVEDAR